MKIFLLPEKNTPQNRFYRTKPTLTIFLTDKYLRLFPAGKRAHLIDFHQISRKIPLSEGMDGFFSYFASVPLKVPCDEELLWQRVPERLTKSFTWAAIWTILHLIVAPIVVEAAYPKAR
jgi:hypothetical protein